MSAAILFVHGAAGDARVWQPVIDRLADGLNGHGLTLSYFGDVPWPDNGSRFGTAIHAADIVAAAREIDGPLHLVCWSYGVHPGLAALLQAPNLFASAFFYEAALPHYIASADERRAWHKSYERVFGPVAEALTDSGAEQAVDAMLGPLASRLSAERRALYRSNARTMPLLMGGGEPPMTITPRELAVIATPCCAAMGTMTQDCFAIPTRALAQALPEGDLLEVEGADHFLPETGTDQFAALVGDWVLARLSLGSRRGAE